MRERDPPSAVLFVLAIVLWVLFLVRCQGLHL